MDSLNQHFEAFLKDRQYLNSVSVRTLEWYGLAFEQFGESQGNHPLTQATARSFVVGLPEHGMIRSPR